MPGIVNGLLIAFTMSIDDFVISYFTAGSQVSTLSMVVYSMVRRRVSPEINALSTLMFVAVLLLLVVINLRQARQDASAGSGRPCGPDPLPFLSQGPNALVIDFFKPERRTRKKLKKTLALILSLAMAASLLSGCVSSREENTLPPTRAGTAPATPPARSSRPPAAR